MLLGMAQPVEGDDSAVAGDCLGGVWTGRKTPLSPDSAWWVSLEGLSFLLQSGELMKNFGLGIKSAFLLQKSGRPQRLSLRGQVGEAGMLD